MSAEPLRRTVRFKNREMTLTWLDPARLPDIERISAASVVPFTPAGDIVLAKLARGLEIPGGEVAESDPDVEATARREAWEEACVVLGALVPVQLIEVDCPGAPDLLRHVVVYAGHVIRMPSFVRRHESSGRVVVSPDEYVERVRFGRPDDRRLLVAQAKAAVGID
ncbi:NUDIX hydrolase [Kutzneria sp. CA-103260]|uniref:NUDIX hydrolase n=1 Tax=Kutzneria sp. CA-103260 TaxID=2802641 RepID=UPI001BADEC6F|nr:NUDIX domain-containing protein [Kutzneria sp. CA-103260]QUQ65523.1 NUDIX domain protein [Kutzneria sp. CA-103260]